MSNRSFTLFNFLGAVISNNCDVVGVSYCSDTNSFCNNGTTVTHPKYLSWRRSGDLIKTKTYLFRIQTLSCFSCDFNVCFVQLGVPFKKYVSHARMVSLNLYLCLKTFGCENCVTGCNCPVFNIDFRKDLVWSRL